MVHEAMEPILESALLSLDADMLEVEALWGWDAKSVIRGVDVLARPVGAAVFLSLHADRTGHTVSPEMRSALQSPQLHTDEFDSQFDEAVTKVEELSMPHLKIGGSRNGIPKRLWKLWAFRARR